MQDKLIHQLAQQVKAARQLAGLSQEALASIAGVGKTAVFDLEHEKASIRLDTLLKILHALNIKLEVVSPHE